VVICLERGAGLHMAQPMPLPLTVSCFTKIQIGLTFLVPADPCIVPEKGPLNVCVCVCVCVCVTTAVARTVEVVLKYYIKNKKRQFGRNLVER